MTAGAVLLVGLAWNPRGGVSGLNVFFVALPLLDRAAGGEVAAHAG